MNSTCRNVSGSRILFETSVEHKRGIVRNAGVHYSLDIRHWIIPPSSIEVQDLIENDLQQKLPLERTPMHYDLRAHACWRYVVMQYQYRTDGDHDFWQFPFETIALKEGDCEDLSFLLASLLIGAGISEYCVRVVIGDLVTGTEQRQAHAWPIYRNEQGRWCTLETTLDERDLPAFEAWQHAGDESVPMRGYSYEPSWCFNSSHVWAIDTVIADWSGDLYMHL